MAKLKDIVAYCDKRTRVSAFEDAPGARNGLQARNNGTVTKIGAAVDAGLEPFRKAAESGVDFLIVHHGMFWGMPKAPKGSRHSPARALRRGNCAVYSSHLPLDSHPEIGNNVLLARELGLNPKKGFIRNKGGPIGRIAPSTLTRAALKRRLRARYPRVVAIEFGSEKPRKVAFCSGSGNGAMRHLLREGVDTMVTGELREEWFNVAQEHGLNLYLCGHYATEVHAVRALAAEVAAKFGLPCEFIATENPL
jgi:dinuclear metal center YbgI/SA1388 family protein